MKDAQNEAQLWNKKYHELLETKQTQTPAILTPQDIEKLSPEEAKVALTQLNDQLTQSVDQSKNLELALQHSK